jgi:hypothetical protein
VTPGAIRAHRRVPAVEDAPTSPDDGVPAEGAARVVWYLSGRGVCRPAVFHLDELAGVWVRGAPCESVVDGGVVMQPTFGGRVEVRLVHLKFDAAAEGEPWVVNYRLLGADPS